MKVVKSGEVWFFVIRNPPVDDDRSMMKTEASHQGRSHELDNLGLSLILSESRELLYIQSSITNYVI